MALGRFAIAWMLLVGLGGCFGPALPTGGPCGNGQPCPPGQFCTTDMVCAVIRQDASTLADAARDIDAIASPAINAPVDPFEIVGSDGCENRDPVSRRPIAIDDSERIFIAAMCDGALRVTTSEDGGRSFSAMTTLAMAGNGSPIAVIGGAEGEALIFYVDQGEMFVHETTDGGASWDAGQMIGEARNSQFGLSVARRGDQVFAAARENGGSFRVAHRVASEWVSSVVASDIAYGDIVVSLDGPLYLVGDSPDLHLHASSDGGESFAPDSLPIGEPLLFSDWTTTPSRIVGVGSAAETRELSLDDPVIFATRDYGLGAAASRRRVVSAVGEDLLIGSERPNGGVELDWVIDGLTTNRPIDEQGRNLSSLAVRSGVGLLLYEGGNALRFGVDFVR